MNTPIRRTVTARTMTELRAVLRGLLLEGEDAAVLLDDINDALVGSTWKRIGSGDLEDFAATMAGECEAFNELEIEIHEAEMHGESA